MVMVHNFLEQSAERTPAKLALICDDARLSYATVDAMANRLARALREQGVRRGDRVALYLPNCVELVIGIFAILKAGGVFVVINSTTKRGKLTYMLNNCRASALIALARQQRLVTDVVAQVASLQTTVLVGAAREMSGDGESTALTFAQIQNHYPPDRPQSDGSEDDLACLIYTSGSTGDPKGVMSAHSNITFAADSIISYLENTPDDVVINALPLSFDYGLYQLLMVFRFGGTLVLERSFAFPAQVLKRMEEERVTGFPGVPTIFALLLQMDLSSYDFSALRYITNTAAAI